MSEGEPLEWGITDEDRKRMTMYVGKDFLDRNPDDLVPDEE